MLPKNENNVFRYNKVDEILIREGKSFTQLKGKKIEDVWYVWDLKDDEWYNDEAVIIMVDEVQLGINNLYTNSIDISWNAYELNEEVYNFDFGYDLKLKWTNDSEIARLLKNEIIEDIQIEEYHCQGKIIKSLQEPEREGECINAWILSGIRIKTVNQDVIIFNGIDSNQIDFQGIRKNNQYRYIKCDEMR